VCPISQAGSRNNIKLRLHWKQKYWPIYYHRIVELSRKNVAIMPFLATLFSISPLSPHDETYSQYHKKRQIAIDNFQGLRYTDGTKTMVTVAQ
jgi:hypothetical protein